MHEYDLPRWFAAREMVPRNASEPDALAWHGFACWISVAMTLALANLETVSPQSGISVFETPLRLRVWAI
jgi:uncharacterized protein (DUF2236 family)